MDWDQYILQCSAWISFFSKLCFYRQANSVLTGCQAFPKAQIPLLLGSADCSSPISHQLFLEDLKTWVIPGFAVSLSHVYSFNSRLLYRSLFCFTFWSIFTVQMVDFDRKGCSETLPTAHKGHEPRGRKSSKHFHFIYMPCTESGDL